MGELFQGLVGVKYLNRNLDTISYGPGFDRKNQINQNLAYFHIVQDLPQHSNEPVFDMTFK